MAVANPTARKGARRITQTTIDNARLPEGKTQHDIFDVILPGFGIRIGKAKKAYFVMTRQLKAGTWRQVRVTLGDCAEMDLAQAREQARKARDLAKQGKDPGDVRKARQQALVTASRDTFAVVRGDFLARYVGRQGRRPAPRTLAEIERALSADIFASWKDRPLVDITDRDILQTLDLLLERGAGTMANRTLAYLRLLFKFAKSRRVISTDPSKDIDKPGHETSRDRVLELGELAAIWHASDPARLPGAVTRALMLTGQRRLEIGALHWSELRDAYPLETDSQGNPTRTCKAIVLPPARCKNGKGHVIPLSPPMVDLIEAQRQQQAALGLETAYVFATSGGKPYAQWSRDKAALDLLLPGLDPWTNHDLRRAFVTHCADKLRIAPHVLEATVNHISGSKGGVAGVYNRAQYLSERADALNTWADFLMRLVGERHSNNVVPLRAAS